MPVLRTEIATLELAGNSPLVLERNNPLLAPQGERGTSSLPFKVARTPANDYALGYPARFDQRAGMAPLRLAAEALDDRANPIASGSLIFRGIEPGSYLYNLEFGTSAVMAKLKAKRLPEFRMGGRQPLEIGSRPAGEELNDARALSLFMYHVVHHWDDYNFTFAPFSNNDCAGQWDSITEAASKLNGVPTHSVNFNFWSALFLPDVTQGIGFSMPLNVQIPGSWDYNLSTPILPSCPLPKLEYVVRQMFDELRLPLSTDVFAEPFLQRQVIVPANANYTYEAVEVSPSNFSYRPYASIADHLPDLTAAEFLRKLMDTYGWHFDVTPDGTCRLLRTAPMLLERESIDITPVVGAALSLELQEPSRITVSPLLAEADRYAQEYGQQPEPDTIGGPSVSAADDLPQATAADTYRLVRAERRYYKSVAKTVTTTDPGTGQSTTATTLSWEQGPFYLPSEQVGTAENEESYEVGVATILPMRYELWTGSLLTTVEAPCFLEPSRGHVNPALPRSPTLRLAIAHGLVPLGQGLLDFLGQPALIPWLSQRNVGPDGAPIGQASLEVHGPAGLVRRYLKPLLGLKSAQRLVKRPLIVTAQQFTRLDFGRMVAVHGDEFLIQRASLTLPLRQPGQIELVPRGDVTSIPSRTIPTDPADVTTTSTSAPEPSCTLSLVDVVRDGSNAQVRVIGAQGALRYQLDTGPLQDVNSFAGLVTGVQYTFWVYDMGVTGCHRSLVIRW